MYMTKAVTQSATGKLYRLYSATEERFTGKWILRRHLDISSIYR